MLGLGSFGVFLAYVMSIIAGALCVVYGLKNWNIPSDSEVEKEVSEEIEWEKRDPENEGGLF
ncbi:MAG TPA: hypothetical protein PKX79_12585 [Spirochaetota bacterium]|nr:hypothetical protein [Spirochaetota bacterium]